MTESVKKADTTEFPKNEEKPCESCQVDIFLPFYEKYVCSTASAQGQDALVQAPGSNGKVQRRAQHQHHSQLPQGHIQSIDAEAAANIDRQLPAHQDGVGDGGHQHPTQTLTDLLTIRCLKGHLDNMTIGLCGDLKFGRTVHSLIHALVRYPGIRFVLISPEELRLPSYIRSDVLDKNHIPYEEVVRLEDAIPNLDLLYMTRVQKERFFNEEDYVRMKDFYILDAKKMQLAKEDMYVLHPLPRVNEISVEVDDDPRAAYFRQSQYGVYIRMALILTLLEIEV